MILKSKKKPASVYVCWNTLTGSSVDICSGQNSQKSIFGFSWIRPWTSWRHLDDIAHHYYRPRRNSEQQFCRFGIYSTHSDATVGRHSPRRTLHDKHQSSLYASIKDPGKCKDQLRQSKDKRSQMLEYVVDHIVKHVNNGSQKMDVGLWYGYTLRDYTQEPDRSITQHSINCYWKNVREWKSNSAQIAKSNLKLLVILLLQSLLPTYHSLQGTTFNRT